MLIANHIKLDRFQVSSHRIHGKICKRGKPFNLQSKPYLRAVSEHISKSQLQRETRQQKKHCKTKYSEGKTKSPKPLTRTAFGFTGIRNSKQKAQAEKKNPDQSQGKCSHRSSCSETTQFHRVSLASRSGEPCG